MIDNLTEEETMAFFVLCGVAALLLLLIITVCCVCCFRRNKQIKVLDINIADSLGTPNKHASIALQQHSLHLESIDEVEGEGEGSNNYSYRDGTKDEGTKEAAIENDGTEFVKRSFQDVELKDMLEASRK